jgi:hypothetical protein
MRRLALAVLLATATPIVAAADPPETHEYLAERPSGFWTSNRPAIGGAYRYRLLLIGCAVALGTGLLMRRVIRKANAERASLAKAQTVTTGATGTSGVRRVEDSAR